MRVIDSVVNHVISSEKDAELEEQRIFSHFFLVNDWSSGRIMHLGITCCVCTDGTDTHAVAAALTFFSFPGN